MVFYAQINENNVCVGVSQLSGEVIADNMVRIDNFDTDKLWCKYDNGQWSTEKFEPQTTAPLTEFEQLKNQLQTTKEAVDVVQTNLSLLPPVNAPTTINDYRQNKIYELDVACNNLILTGFPSLATGTEHQYKFDMEYQANMAQQGVMLSLDPTQTTVMWPTADVGVIPHTREQFIKLCQDAQAWKTTNTYRYFGLKAQVVACETVEAVNAIVW